MAAKWNNLTWEQFIEMEGEDQSRLVAVYETSMQIDAVLAMESNRLAKRQHKRGHSGS